jgi:hypothetical protein
MIAQPIDRIVIPFDTIVIPENFALAKFIRDPVSPSAKALLQTGA